MRLLRQSRTDGLALDFTGGVLDNRITFTRGSSATRYNSAGLLETVADNVPRFDYDPVTLQPLGLLIEEQRTNMVVNSGQADLWGRSDATSVLDAVVNNPDGTDAYRAVEGTTAPGQHRLQQPLSMAAGTTYTASVFVKAGTRSRACFRLYDGGATQIAVVTANLTNGSQETGSGTITHVGNGWYRLSITGTCVTAGGTAYLNLADNTNTISYNGDGASYLYAWGMQLEAGAFATSYIPTTATAATRAADVAYMTSGGVTSWYNPTEGSFVVEARCESTATATATALVARDPGGLVYTALMDFSGNNARFVVRDGGASQALISLPTIIRSFTRWAGAYKANDFAMAEAGELGGTDSSGTVPTGISHLQLGSYNGSATPLNGHIKRIRYIPRRVSDAELQALTA
jgi:hypothetical protein